MMDIDGNNFVQVTESNDREVLPEFSPDGNYLLVGTDYTKTSSLSAIWRLKIIPADGNKYNVDPITENSPGVIPVIAHGDEVIQTASNRGMLWR
jgi:Tol biopolymer transport system component